MPVDRRRRARQLGFFSALLGLCCTQTCNALTSGEQALGRRGVLTQDGPSGGAVGAAGTSNESLTKQSHTCSRADALSERQVEVAFRRKCRALCETSDGGGCNTTTLEPCMGVQRVRHAQKVQGSWAGRRVAQLADPVEGIQITSDDLTFVVFFAVGKRNAEAYPNHQYVDPDTNFIPVLRRSHPGARIVVLSDEHTPFAPGIGVDVFRVPMDSERMGRNAYANYYQYLGQIEYLRALKAENSQHHVVFMDMDVLVLDSILELFCSDFGYGITINANEFDPVDIGLQFVQSSHYDEAIAFLQELTDRYLDLIGHPNSFTTGQVVMRNTLEMGHKDVMIAKIATTATRNNNHCRTVRGGKHRVCFFPCLRYNYWEDCTADIGKLLPQDPALFREHGVKVMQFVAWRKPGLEVVAKAFLERGLEAAYSTFAELPHTEAEYNARFAFNGNVKKICYKDDRGCTGVQMSDEAMLWPEAMRGYVLSISGVPRASRRPVSNFIECIRRLRMQSVHRRSQAGSSNSKKPTTARLADENLEAL